MILTLDGSTYYSRSTGLAKVEDTQKVTLCAWFLVGANDAAQMYGFSLAGDQLSLQRNAANKIVFTGKNSSGTTILTLTSSTSYTSSSTWRNVIASADLSAGTGFIYINRSDDTVAGATLTDDTLSLVQAANPVAFAAKSDATLPWVGGVYDFALWPGVYIDPSDTDDLARLVSSDGLTGIGTHSRYAANPGPTSGTPKPVGYGRQGVLASEGTPAGVLFSGGFHDNRGTGGSFSLTGTKTLGVSDGPDDYRQSSTGAAIPGQRSFDSEKSGFTFPRHETFIEKREGHTLNGLRMGTVERDERFRQERPAHSTFARLIFGTEDDSPERRY